MADSSWTDPPDAAGGEDTDIFVVSQGGTIKNLTRAQLLEDLVAAGSAFTQTGVGATTSDVDTKLKQIKKVDDYDSFAEAVTAQGATPTVLYGSNSDKTIASGTTVTIPTTTTYVPRAGVVDGIAGGGAETLTINGGLIADPSQQIFGSNLTVNGAPKVEFLTPDMWGAANDGSTDDLAATQAMVVAVESMDNHPPMKFLASDQFYRVSAPINITDDNPLVFIGDNYLRSQIRAVNATPFAGAVFNFVNTGFHKYIVFKDLWINCNADAGYGIYGEYNAGASGVHHIVIEHCRIQGATTYGIFLEYGWDIDLIRNIVTENSGGGIYLHESANMINMIGNKIYANSEIGVVISGGSGAFISGNTIEDNTKGGLKISAFIAPCVTGNYFEKNGQNVTDENYAVWWSAGSDVYGGEFTSNFITGSGVAGLAGMKIDYADGVVISGNTFRNINYAFDQSNQAVITRPLNTTIENNTYYSDVTTKWNPHATYWKTLANLGNRIFIPGLFERSGGNLIPEHPVEWARTVSGASTLNVVAGEYPSYTITKAVGETAYTTLTLDFSKEYKHLRGKHISLGVTASAPSAANLQLYIGAINDVYALTTTPTDYAMTYQIGAAETTVAFLIRSATDAVDITINDFWITSGLVKPEQSIFDIPIKKTATWDPGAGAETKQVSVFGAEFGDEVHFAAPYDRQDRNVTAYVQAADVVEGRIDAGADLASGTWNVTVRKP